VCPKKRKFVFAVCNGDKNEIGSKYNIQQKSECAMRKATWYRYTV
jgi:hypothetical protein